MPIEIYKFNKWFYGNVRPSYQSHTEGYGFVSVRAKYSGWTSGKYDMPRYVFSRQYDSVGAGLGHAYQATGMSSLPAYSKNLTYY